MTGYESKKAMAQNKLAQPAQEPVAWMVYTQDGQSVYVTDNPTDIQESQRSLPLYTTPPQRPWVGLTDESITQVIDLMPNGINGWMSDWDLYEFARAVLAKSKEENT